VALDILSHLWPEVGGGDFNVSFVSRIVSSEDAVVGLAHGFFSVPHGEVERCSWVVEIIQPNPDYLVFILKEFVDHGRVISLVLFCDRLRPLVGVPEGLDALQDFFLHLEFVEVHMEWIKCRNAGDVFFGPRESAGMFDPFLYCMTKSCSSKAV